MMPAMNGTARRRGMCTLLTALLIGAAGAGGQTPDGTPFRIERLQPALDDVIAGDARQ